MLRPGIWIWSLLLFFAALLSAQDAIREDLQVTLVSLYASATDANGNFVTDLRPEDFILREDGQVQSIASFSGGTEDVSLTVAFLMDNSASMTARDLEMARAAGLLLLREMKSNDKLLLITFRHDARALVEATFDKKKMQDTIQSIRPQYGTTALYDAIYLAAGKLDNELGRKVLLLFSDGQDNSSTRKLNDLLAGVAALSDITVISLGTSFHQQEANRYGALEEHEKGKSALTKLSQVTGGFSVFPDKQEEVERAVGDLRDWIRNQYTIGYYPTNKKRDGSWREIALACKRQGIRLTFRRGYFAPCSIDPLQTKNPATTFDTGSVQQH